MAQANLPVNVRPFDWRDLPALYRLRSQSVFLDSALLLTRGPLPLPGALFSFLAPSMGLFTCVHEGSKQDGGPLIGQLIHPPGAPFAHLTFLTPDGALESPRTSGLVEYLMALSGERGALRLLADADEHSPVYDALRSSGFAVYSRQRIWQVPLPRRVAASQGSNGRPPAQPRPWRGARDQDVLPIRLLYNALVPGLVQQVEPLATQTPRGLVYYQAGELLAYMEVKYGHRGIWVQPFIHPDAENSAQYFIDLLNRLPSRGSRPVYICVRSYQSWLEPAIETLGAVPGPRQAVMARQLAAAQKSARPFALPARVESAQPEATLPIARFEPSTAPSNSLPSVCSSNPFPESVVSNPLPESAVSHPFPKSVVT